MTHPPLSALSRDDLASLLEQQQAAYAELKTRGLKLDLTRGKPSAAQLDLANELLNLPRGFKDSSGTDVRNYGGLAGLTELREIFAELLWIEPEQVIAGGNSSLTMMRDCLIFLMLFGARDSDRAWGKEDRIKFICPVPGYDRHFTLLESLGIEMITVPMNDDGPDSEATAALVKNDRSIKGMWIVPTYANPAGSICSQEVAARLASMETAANDFKIFWDNAYALHHLTEEEAKSADILTLAAASGHPDRPLMFASTSKITYAGSGVAFLGASEANIAWYLGHLGNGSIGPDKVNQLRHIQFFGSAQGVRDHMAKHRAIIAPKFDEVDRVFSERLGGYAVATWNKPAGGYFVNVDVVPGTAARVIALAKDAGVALTQAGSSFPHGDDPNDQNIRIAPTMPPLDEVTAAIDAVATCVLLAAAEKLLQD
ncbi:MAG: aminotransferase class I/II-fold pyridoxal phosphate-dependent enzyme [Nocardioides sp.]|uniref:aminotransferase class I/II-fold pyridoxal phosphate-dependent enzyme n=1 Tax=Nocardioides sp. TaxID=35761 RepID=UPI003264C409